MRPSTTAQRRHYKLVLAAQTVQAMLHTSTLTEGWIEISDNNGLTWIKLPEYKTEVQPKRASCYVEAKTGQRFRLMVQDRNIPTLRTDFVAKFFYDGNLAVSHVVQKTRAWPSSVVGIDNEENETLPFIFSEVSGIRASILYRVQVQAVCGLI